MKRYTAANIQELQSGWYWVSQFQGQDPKVAMVYEVQSIGISKLPGFVVDFGYGPKNIHIIPGHQNESDYYSDLVLLGPIPQLSDEEVRGEPA